MDISYFSSDYYFQLNESSAAVKLLNDENNHTVIIEDAITYNSGANINKWYYFSVITKIGAASSSVDIYIDSSTTPFYSSSGVFKKDGTIDLCLNLKVASFREIKLFPYSRIGANKYLSHTQADPSKDEMTFYYPLDGKVTTRYLYNAMNPEATVENPLKDAYWIEALDPEGLLCPNGYYYNSVIDITLNPTCSKQQYLKFNADVTYDKSIKTKETTVTPIGISVWIYYDKHTNKIFSMGSSSATELLVEMTTSKISFSVGSKCEIKLKYNSWIHFGYTNQVNSGNYITKIYLDNSLVKEYELTTQPKHDAVTTNSVSEIVYTLKVYQNAIIKDFQFFTYDSANEIKDFEQYMNKRIFSIDTTQFNIPAYIPGLSISTDNKIIGFFYGSINNNAQGVIMENIGDPGKILGNL